jgi:pilus assembly protein CpaB
MRLGALIVLALGVVMAGGSVTFTHVWLRARQQAPAEAAAAAPPAALASIVVARSDIPFGKEIMPDLVRLQPWPIDALPAGALTSLEALLGKDDSEPRRARRPIAAGEPVLQSKISGFGEKVTVAHMIDTAKRAVAIRVNDVTGVAGFVTPGDRVDIVLTRRLEQDELRADTILQNIVVRGIDQAVDESADKPAVARTVTVELDPDQAQKVALAQQAGTLSLALRNLGDDALVAIPAMRSRDLGAEPSGRAAAPGGEGTAARLEVTVVRGGQRSTVEVRR